MIFPEDYLYERTNMLDRYKYLIGSNGLSFGDPDKIEERFCGVCASKCILTETINGPTSMAESMAGGKHLHNVYKCPYYGTSFHDLAYELIIEMGSTASDRVRALIKEDLNELLEKNIPGIKIVR